MAILATLAGWAVLLALGGALLWLPGGALRAALGAWAGARDPALGAPDGALGALLDSLGLSLAFWPLLLLYAALVHIPITPRTVAAVLGLAAVGLAALLWRAARRRLARRPAVGAAVRAIGPLAALTALALVVRFAAVRDLVLPNWGDSFHHTLITQLFLNQQGIPQGYMPYAPVYSFTYHFGFHGLAALWALLAAVPSWSAVLTIGQILNALAVPAAYVLTRELFRNRLAALASAVVVGFLSGMPAAYVDWGRYTQLAGQVLLPFVLVWLIRWLELPPATPWRAGAPRLALAGIGAAGLGLTHYRVLIMYALFVLAYLAIRGLAIGLERGAAGPSRRARLAVLAGRAIAVGALGGLLFAPWLGNLLAEYLPGLFHRLGAATASYVQEYTPDTFLTAYVGLLLPLLAALGVGLVLLQGPGRARVMVAVLLAWTGLLALSARPDVVHLPGVGAMGTFTIGIALYLPLGTLAGPGIARPLIALRAWLRTRHPALRLPRGLRRGRAARRRAGSGAGQPRLLDHRPGLVLRHARRPARADLGRRPHAARRALPHQRGVELQRPRGHRHRRGHVAAPVGGRRPPDQRAAALLGRRGRAGRRSGRARAGALSGDPDPHAGEQRRPAPARPDQLRLPRRAHRDHLGRRAARRSGGLLPALPSGRELRFRRAGQRGRALPLAQLPPHFYPKLPTLSSGLRSIRCGGCAPLAGIRPCRVAGGGLNPSRARPAVVALDSPAGPWGCAAETCLIRNCLSVGLYR